MRGRLVFMQHGLNDNYKCFYKLMTNLVKEDSKRYIDFGVISLGERPQFAPPPHSGNRGYEGYGESGTHYSDTYLDYIKENFGNDANISEHLIAAVNKLSDSGYNILIRAEFSTGVESLDEQKSQMTYILSLLDGHTADLCFIGHSMGGLTSLNFAMDYKRNNPEKDVKVITLNTPYFKNEYALAAWTISNNEKYNNNGEAMGQRVGYANRDLACAADADNRVALNELYKKWRKYREAYNDIEAHAVAVSIYSEKSGETAQRKGDGIVDIPSQQGHEKYVYGRVYHGLIVEPVIYGEKFANTNPLTVSEPSVSILNMMDTENPYHHCNSPSLPEVAKIVNDLLTLC